MSQSTMKRASLLDDQPELSAAPPRKPAQNAGERGDRIKLIIAVIGIVAAIGISVYSFTGGAPDIGEQTRYMPVIDSETGEVIEKFDFSRTGEPKPWANASGKRTLYPAELCYWNKDGTAKAKPTFVLLNQFKGLQGDTICPDCGRKVVARNPPPPPEMMAKAYEEAAK